MLMTAIEPLLVHHSDGLSFNSTVGSEANASTKIGPYQVLQKSTSFNDGYYSRESTGVQPPRRFRLRWRNLFISADSEVGVRKRAWTTSFDDQDLGPDFAFGATWHEHLADDGQSPRELKAIFSKRRTEGEGLSSVGVAIAIFKANCGCGILYAPRAVFTAGWGACPVVFIAVFALAVFSSFRLLQCALKSPGTYGEIMEQSFGSLGRSVCSLGVVLLQSGICAMFFIFMGQVLQEQFMPHKTLPVCISVLAIAVTPLVMIRKVSKLWLANLIGTALVLVGVFTVISILGPEAVTNVSEIQQLSPLRPTFLLSVGSACFMFEGVAPLIPTFESSREPERFPMLFFVVMTFVLLLVLSVGMLGYLAFGDEVQPLILLNLQGGPVVNCLRSMFAFAMFCTFALQLLPAIRLIESAFFSPVTSPTFARKSMKSAFRTAYVFILAGVAIVGATSLDSFFSLIGAFCGMPLAFIFPLACHYKLVATGWDKVLDLLLVLVSTVLTVMVSATCIAQWN